MSELRLKPGDSLEIDFSHLVVFHSVGPDEYEVWSHKAILTLRGVSKLEISGRFEDNDYIFDEDLADAVGKPFSAEKMLEELNVSRLTLRFFSGTVVAMDCEKALLRIIPGGQYTESWSGPLGSGT